MKVTSQLPVAASRAWPAAAIDAVAKVLRPDDRSFEIDGIDRGKSSEIVRENAPGVLYSRLLRCFFEALPALGNHQRSAARSPSRQLNCGKGLY